MAESTTNRGKAALDAMKKGDKARLNQARNIPYEKKRMDVVRSAMAKHKQLSPEELEKIKPSTAPLRDPDDTPSEYAKKKGRAQAMEATDG